MKPTYGIGRYVTHIPPKGMSITVDDTMVTNSREFFLQCSYYWEAGYPGNQEQPEEKDYFELTEIQTQVRILFTEWNGLELYVSPNVKLNEILSEDTIFELQKKVLREIREEASYG